MPRLPRHPFGRTGLEVASLSLGGGFLTSRETCGEAPDILRHAAAYGISTLTLKKLWAAFVGQPHAAIIARKYRTGNQFLIGFISRTKGVLEYLRTNSGVNPGTEPVAFAAARTLRSIWALPELRTTR